MIFREPSSGAFADAFGQNILHNLKALSEFQLMNKKILNNYLQKIILNRTVKQKIR